MKNPRYQYTFRYIGTLLYSLFVGFLVSYAIAIMSGALLYSPSHFKGSYFDFPELLNAFVIASGFFLGGILAPWLISLFFGTVDKRIVFASYFFTTFLTIIYVILLATGEETERNDNYMWTWFNALITASGFFLGGILAPWLISLFFGTVDKRIVFASYFFTTFLTIIYVILLATGKDVGEGFGNFWALTFAIVSALSIVPLCILSHLLLYFSYKK